jgi:hypothetical protein
MVCKPCRVPPFQYHRGRNIQYLFIPEISPGILPNIVQSGMLLGKIIFHNLKGWKRNASEQPCSEQIDDIK